MCGGGGVCVGGYWVSAQAPCPLVMHREQSSLSECNAQSWFTQCPPQIGSQKLGQPGFQRKHLIPQTSTEALTGGRGEREAFPRGAGAADPV